MIKIRILPILFLIILFKFVNSFRSPEFSLPPELLFEKSCKKLFIAATTTNSTADIWSGGCECTIPRRPGKGAKCCCSGEGVKQIGASIDAKITAGYSISTIFLFNVSLIELEPKSLQIVPNLEELFVDSCFQLKRVHSRAFAGLQTLRKIRISNCPNLVHWEGTMLRENPRLQTLIVRNNDLWELPKMEMESAQNVLPMERIDFSRNCLRQIGKGAIRNVAVKTVDFHGNGMCLWAIGPQAFAGSKFIFLKLSGNPRLDQIHPNAFDGLLHIEHLDISDSSISLLPYVGLRSLKSLNLQFVPRLKQLPPVLAFPNLVQAEFTYSHHCCFFKYASRDFYARKKHKDRGGNEEKNLEKNYREIQRRMCKEDGKEKGEGRRRRHIFVQDEGDELFKELAEWYKKVELKQTSKMIELNGNGTAMKKGELKAFNDEELGKGFRLVRKCDQNAIVDQFYLNISCTPQPDALNPCEDIVNNLPRLVIWPIWIGAIFGNLAVWAVICTAWQRKMRLHYLFMLNLSLADFLTGVYLAILAFADLRTANEYYNYAVEWQTGNGCALAGFLSVFASELSIFSMLMIAIEIFYNSRFAFYGRHLSPFYAGISLLFGYIYSTGMAILPLFGISSYQHSSICLPLHIQNPIDKFYLLFGLSFSGFAFASMICIYVLLNCALRRSKAISTTRLEEDRQILRRTLVLIGTDMLCWVPTLFFGLTAALGLPLITLSSAKWCLVLFYPINSCANPLLYVFLTRTWRDAKKKAGPIIRRSLATSKTPKGGTFLSWNKLEKFYSSNGPKNGQQLKIKGEGNNDGGTQRPNTIHNCFNGRGERRKLLAEIFGEKRIEHKRRASEGESVDEIITQRDILEPKEEACYSSKTNNGKRANSSTHIPIITAPRRKSLLPRSKISAPPQMSDISESSTSLGSSSQQPNNKMERKEVQKKQQIVEDKKPQQQRGNDKRGSNSSSNGGDGDSGKGDSLHSAGWAKSARPSVITLFWKGIGRSPLLMEKCGENDEEAENSGKIGKGREELISHQQKLVNLS